MAQTPESYRRFLKSYFPVWREDFESFVQEFSRTQGSKDYRRIAHVSALTYQMVHRQPVLDDLPQLQMPVLLLIGQKDRTVFGRRFALPEVVSNLGDFPKLGKQAASLIRSATLVALDDVGHVPHLEAPNLFLRHVLAFQGAVQ